MARNSWQPPESETLFKEKPRGNKNRLWLFWAGFALLIIVLKSYFPTVSITTPGALYSLILLFILGSGMSYYSQTKASKLIMMAGISLLLVAGISVVYLYKEDAKARFMAAASPGNAAVSADGNDLIIHRSLDGHFWINAEINGRPIRMMVDTGASYVVLGPDDAYEAGFEVDMLDYSGQAQTANGIVLFARENAESISFGGLEFYDTPVTITKSEMPGSLMGMSLLQRFASVELKADRLILKLND
ncbi:retropepsin-like aspartic protease family protein [Kordiimonas sediminis]|nr:TIGR02281 family clan AA aspartic protease [Kordiimonas sediminis]